MASRLSAQIFGNEVRVQPGSINIHFALNEVGTLTCRVVDSFAPLIQAGQLIEIFEAKDEESGFLRVFAGRVSSVSQAPYDINSEVLWCADVAARDFNAVPARRTTTALNADGTVKFPNGESWNNITTDYVVKKVAEHYLQDDAIHWEGYVQSGPKLSAYAIDLDQYVSEIYDDLARIASSLGDDPLLWVYYIDADLELHFFPIGSESAPVGIGGGQDVNILASEFGDLSLLAFTESVEQTANLIVLRLGHYVLDPVTEYFTGDGEAKAWNLTKPCNSVPVIKLQPNGSTYAETKTVGVSGLDNPPNGEGADFYFNAGSPTISADAPMMPGDILEVTYQGQDTRKIVKVDQAGIQARIEKEGGSGIYGRVIDLSDPATSSDVNQLAQSWLNKLKGLSRSMIVRVWDEELLVHGFRIGQMVFCNPQNFQDLEVTGEAVQGTYLIRSIDMQDDPDDRILRRTMELVQGPILYDSLEYLQDLSKQGAPAARKTAQPIGRHTAQAKFNAPAADQVSDILEPVEVGGTPYQSSANMLTAGTEDFKIDWQYNDADINDAAFDDSWVSVFPTIDGALTTPIIAAGNRGSATVSKFAPALEFTAGVTRLRAKLLTGAGGTFLTAHLLWR